MDISSLLSSVEQSYDANTSSSSATSASSDQADFKSMTVGQFRDITDQLASDGKLTDLQQMALISTGLQDNNAYDKSYQPYEEGLSYTRSDTNTYDFLNIVNDYAACDVARATQSGENIFQSIGTLLQSNESKDEATAASSVNLSA